MKLRFNGSPASAGRRKTQLMLGRAMSGYTRLSEELAPDALNAMVESYFSAFLDVIQDAGGDINETAGDGFMTIFDAPDPHVHAAKAAEAAMALLKPETCWSTNVGGLTNVIEEAERQRKPPWLIFASSREVYGQPASLPATEDAPLRPVNVYGRSKVEGEYLVDAARARGLRTAIVRLSNVYGSTRDHADRVVPAFVRAAIVGSPLRVEGVDHAFDFTHLQDAARGIVQLVEHIKLDQSAPPPIHLLTGHATTLGQLAALAVDLAGGTSSVVQSSPRSFDVSHFYGSPERARTRLGWSARIALRDGLAMLIKDFRADLG